MALSFEEEIRAALHQAAEQDPVLRALSLGERSVSDIDVQAAIEVLAGMGAMHTTLILKIAKEIDQLRAAINGG